MNQIDTEPVVKEWFIWQRVLCFLAGFVWPCFCFGMVWNEPFDKPLWQSGELSAYTKLMLGGASSRALYPLLLYSMASLSLLLVSFHRFAQKPWVRFGVYSGVLLACHYIVLFWLTFDLLQSFEGIAIAAGWILGCALLLGLVKFLEWLNRKIGGYRFAVVCVVSLVIVESVSLFFNVWLDGRDVWEAMIVPFAFVYFVSLFVAPCITLAAYVAMSWKLVRFRRFEPFRFSLAQFMGIVSWLAGYLATVRWSITLALVEYAQLPVEPRSRCYVATAASQGHPWLVGSYEIRCCDGSRRRANLQLRRLKMAEIVFATIFPRCHTLLRTIYDAIGPWVASLIRFPVLADVAYLALKPMEFFSTVLVWIAVPHANQIAIYAPDHAEKQG